MFITKWFFSHTTLIWASFIIIAFIGAYYSASRDLVPEFTPRKRVVSFLYFLGSMIGLVFVSYVPTTWMGYSVPEDRILIMTVSILCGFLVYISFFAGFAFREGFKFANNNSLAPIIILNFLLLFFAITIPLNYKNQYYSDFGPIQEKYASDWDRANAEIQTEINSGKKDIVVQNVAYNITENERISEDKASWVNQCAAEYYQVDSIVSR
jgi:hypothetical protein